MAKKKGMTPAQAAAARKLEDLGVSDVGQKGGAKKDGGHSDYARKLMRNQLIGVAIAAVVLAILVPFFLIFVWGAH